MMGRLNAPVFSNLSGLRAVAEGRKVLELGQRGPEVFAVRAGLHYLRYSVGGFAPCDRPLSAAPDDADPMVFDDSMGCGVTAFRREHGLSRASKREPASWDCEAMEALDARLSARVHSGICGVDPERGFRLCVPAADAESLVVAAFPHAGKMARKRIKKEVEAELERALADARREAEIWISVAALSLAAYLADNPRALLGK